MTKEHKKKIRKERKQKGLKPIKLVWVVKDKAFVETVITTGLTDNSYFQIVSGLSENDQVVNDIDQTDEMKKLYKMMVGGGL